MLRLPPYSPEFTLRFRMLLLHLAQSDLQAFQFAIIPRRLGFPSRWRWFFATGSLFLPALLPTLQLSQLPIQPLFLSSCRPQQLGLLRVALLARDQLLLDLLKGLFPHFQATNEVRLPTPAFRLLEAGLAVLMFDLLRPVAFCRQILLRLVELIAQLAQFLIFLRQADVEPLHLGREFLLFLLQCFELVLEPPVEDRLPREGQS